MSISFLVTLRLHSLTRVSILSAHTTGDQVRFPTTDGLSTDCRVTQQSNHVQQKSQIEAPSGTALNTSHHKRSFALLIHSMNKAVHQQLSSML